MRERPNCVDVSLPPWAEAGPKDSSQQRDFHQTIVRLTTRRFGDMAPVSEKGCLNFLFVGDG
jgi:hypothetical protein